jgi:branched-chain amino acid transport system substrate-binding protein
VFISYDDAFSPPKAVEQARWLVESDEVLLIFQSLGTQSNAAIQKYLNAKKVPQLFVASGTTRFGDPQHFPWTMGWQPNYQNEGRIYGKYIKEHYADHKVAALWQNDDSGKDQMKGLRDGLGTAAGMLVADVPFEITDPTLDSHIARLKDSGADIFVSWSTPRASAQTIRKIAELGWKPIFFLSSTSASVGSVLRPAGLDNAKGIISSTYTKDPTDPAWKGDPEVEQWHAFMDRYLPEGDKSNPSAVYGYAAAGTLAEVLRRCGDELTRENVMKQAANLKGLRIPMLLPGIEINTSSDDFYPIEQMQLMQFDGQKWQLMGGLISGEVGTRKPD